MAKSDQKEFPLLEVSLAYVVLFKGLFKHVYIDIFNVCAYLLW